MKTKTFRKTGITTLLLAAALPLSLNALATRATAQAAADTATSGTAQITIAPTATYYWVNGNAAKFKQDTGTRDGLATGIQDFTYTKQVDDLTRVEFNGRAIFGNEDYLLHFNARKEGWFQLDFGYKQFFTPYDADGLYFSYNGHSANGSDFAKVTNQMGVTRADFWIDIKTLFPKIPTITVHYDHAARYGDAGSTIMAGYTLAGVTGNRGILPAYYYINEGIDTVTLDVDQQFKTWSYGAGVWGQHTTTKDATYSVAGNLTTTTGYGNNTTTDAIGAHAYVTGDITKTLTYGASALYDQFEYDVDSGGRYGYAGNEQIYDPISRVGATTAPNGATYANIYNESTYKEWSASGNLNWRPTKDWSIVGSLAFQDYRTDASAGNTGNSLASPTPSALYDSGNNWFQSTETLEIHYTGLKNWTHTLSAEMNQGTGSNDYNSFTNAAAIANLVPNAYSTTNQTRYTTKFAYTANWYARPGLSFTGQVYNKNDRNYYDTPAATHTGNYPGFMSEQLFETNDINVRMNWRPLTWVTNVLRYDYQISYVDTAYDKLLANYNFSTGRLQSGKTQTHIISENLTLTPAPRVSINLNGSVIYDQTKIPANVYYASNMLSTTAASAFNSYSSANQTAINADNNYFNAGFNVYYAATDLDDVFIDYNYYKTFNYVNNSKATVPYGANEHQYVITLGWTRRFNPNFQFNLGYTYIGYKNFAQGGNLNYHANGVTGTLRYKF